jgi:hypothetical protein
MGVGTFGRRGGVLALALLVAAALWATLPAGADAAKLVGKDGKVYACYKANGRSKGAVRLVARKSHCRHGERKISWNVTGPRGEAGQGGENGTNGESGGSGERGSAVPLEQRVTTLTNKVTALESILNGITNADLLGMLSKLQGISGTQLQETVASLADAHALCEQATKLTTQVNALGTALGGLSLNSVLTTLGGLLNIPTLPTPLPAFSCP